MNGRLWAHIAIFSANIIYGINYTIAKLIMPDYVLPFGLTLIRIVGGGLMFWILGMAFVREKMDRKDIGRIFLAGFTGVFFNQFLFLNGLNYTTPIDASIIMVVNPIMVLIFSAILLKDKITSAKIGGILLGATGVVILILKGGKVDFGSDNFLGNLMIFGNATSYALFLVITKPLMKKYHTVTVVRWAFLVGSFFIIPIGYEDVFHINWAALPLHIILAIIYVVLFTTFIAYILNIYGLKKVKPATVSIYIYLQPVIAAIVAILLGKDSVTGLKVFSTVLIFIGVYMVVKPLKSR